MTNFDKCIIYSFPYLEIIEGRHDLYKFSIVRYGILNKSMYNTLRCKYN